MRGTISSHSFRSGVASMMGSQGFSDEEIKLVGRWSSRAFTAYTKLARTQRATMVKKLKYCTCKPKDIHDYNLD